MPEPLSLPHGIVAAMLLEKNVDNKRRIKESQVEDRDIREIWTLLRCNLNSGAECVVPQNVLEQFKHCTDVDLQNFVEEESDKLLEHCGKLSEDDKSNAAALLQRRGRGHIPRWLVGRHIFACTTWSKMSRPHHPPTRLRAHACGGLGLTGIDVRDEEGAETRYTMTDLKHDVRVGLVHIVGHTYAKWCRARATILWYEKEEAIMRRRLELSLVHSLRQV
jgi:hypothetical protein